MAVFALGVALLAASFVVQLVLWRVMLPKRQTGALLLIFTAVAVLTFASAWAAGRPILLSAPDLVRLGLFYVSCALAYVVLYSAIEQQSPTLAIVSHLRAAGSAGSTGPELFARFGGDGALSGRVVLMAESGWVQRRDDDTLALTQQGRFYAQVFDYGCTIVGLGHMKGG